MALKKALAEFLVRESSRPWVRGEHDCGLWLADWYMQATGAPDPAATLRGAAEGGDAAWQSGATLLREVRRIVRGLGLARTAAPEPGDIGVVALEDGGRRFAVGAIRVRGGWVMPASGKGLVRAMDARARTIAAWRMP